MNVLLEADPFGLRKANENMADDNNELTTEK
jgi:hypothetical protein